VALADWRPEAGGAGAGCGVRVVDRIN